MSFTRKKNPRSLDDRIAKVPVLRRWAVIPRKDYKRMLEQRRSNGDEYLRVWNESTVNKAWADTYKEQLGKEKLEHERLKREIKQKTTEAGTLGEEPFCGCCNKVTYAQKFGSLSFLCAACRKVQVVFLGGMSPEVKERAKKLARENWELHLRVETLGAQKCTLELKMRDRKFDAATEREMELAKEVVDLQKRVRDLLSQQGQRENRPARVGRTLDV